jgi:carbon monoxide dehydrogenase subunit G
MYVERTFTVSRPVDAVFAYLADFENTNTWDPGTVSTTRVSGDGGVGTTYANTSRFAGRQVELTYETTVRTPSLELRFRGTNPSSTAIDWMRFSAVGDDATRIHYRADFAFHGWLRFVAPLVVGPRLGPLADETVEQLTAALLAHT